MDVLWYEALPRKAKTLPFQDTQGPLRGCATGPPSGQTPASEFGGLKHPKDKRGYNAPDLNSCDRQRMACLVVSCCSLAQCKAGQ